VAITAHIIAQSCGCKYLHGTQATAIQTNTPAAQPGSLVLRASASVCVSLPVPAAVWATLSMAGPVRHALPVSWLVAPQQLASRGDLDIPHTEASHAGADVGAQRQHDY